MRFPKHYEKIITLSAIVCSAIFYTQVQKMVSAKHFGERMKNPELQLLVYGKDIDN